ncbi:MAG TPA: protein kinase [Vicinamibacteria bacterium]|nr:protein kinase [Vicinamibacteria bacterium]
MARTMALAPGTRLGPYEIVSPIGKGGMGEVYRARDTKLERDVAIKVLPDELAAEEERVRRFEREAKLLASLNHPNIASIYGFEDSDRRVKALVLEHVEGPTLAERIQEGPIQMEDAVAIAKQIADALEAGHEAGVIHRDLKPANIKLKEDGTVKVLDYGLAKALEADSASEADAELSHSPTLTRQGTQLGMILGTAAYMSPEQAKGKRVDKRTDIWAFGAVLYEMLTGHRAFAGEDVSDTLAAVLRAEPDWTALPATTPSFIRQVLRLCLTKNARGRARDIGDVRLALEGAFETVAQVGSTSDEATTTWAKRRRVVPLVVGVALVAAMISGLAVWSAMRSPVVAVDVTRFTIDSPDPFEVAPRGKDLAVSPDGRFVVYSGRMPDSNFSKLYVRWVDGLDALPLSGTQEAESPFVSPDGQWIGFWMSGELRKVSALGGPVIKVASVPLVMRGASWVHGNRIIFGSPGGGLFGVSGEGGEPEQLTTPPEGESHGWPSGVPNDGVVLFARSPVRFATSGAELAALSLDTGEVRTLGLTGTSPRYVRTGHLVFAVADGTVRVVPFDPDRLEVTGGPVPLVENVVVKTSGAADFDVSDAGRLVYLEGSGSSSASRRLVWVSRDGREEPIDASGGGYHTPHISPDGTRVAVDRADADGADIWIFDLSRGTETKLTADAFVEANPLWTPDGTGVVYGSAGAIEGGIFWKSADGTGEADRLMSVDAGTAMVGPSAWSADGTTLAFWIVNVSTDIGLLSVGGDGTPTPLIAGEFMEQVPAISPDGMWIAYESDQSGREEIYAQRFPRLGQRVTISTDGGRQPVWSRDGRELFYRSANGMMAVPIDTSPTFSVGQPTSLFEDDYYFFLSRRTYDVAPDGERFLMVTAGDAAADARPFRIVVVEHWFEELKARVPTN